VTVKSIVGIDPGINGAIAVLESDGDLRTVFTIPTELVGKKGRKRIDLVSTKQELDKALGGTLARVAIEDVSARAVFAKGGMATFSLGESTGALRPIFTLQQLTINWVYPQTWKAAFGLNGEGKEAAVATVSDLYAEDYSHLTIDQAEAILIARYALDKFN